MNELPPIPRTTTGSPDYPAWIRIILAGLPALPIFGIEFSPGSMLAQAWSEYASSVQQERFHKFMQLFDEKLRSTNVRITRMDIDLKYRMDAL